MFFKSTAMHLVVQRLVMDITCNRVEALHVTRYLSNNFFCMFLPSADVSFHLDEMKAIEHVNWT